MTLGESTHDDVLLAERWSADDKRVTGTNKTMWTRALAVDVHLAALAGLLCLGTRAEQTGDVQPHIEA